MWYNKDIPKLKLLKVGIFTPKVELNKKYTPEFKIMVVETMHNEGLSYRETDRRFGLYPVEYRRKAA